MSLVGEVGKAKAWWKSKTIIATIIGIIGGLMEGFLNINLGNIIGLVWEGADTIAFNADSVWLVIQNTIVFGVAWWGRVKATVTIKPIV